MNLCENNTQSPYTLAQLLEAKPQYKNPSNLGLKLHTLEQDRLAILRIRCLLRSCRVERPKNYLSNDAIHLYSKP